MGKNKKKPEKSKKKPAAKAAKPAKKAARAMKSAAAKSAAKKTAAPKKGSAPKKAVSAAPTKKAAATAAKPAKAQPVAAKPIPEKVAKKGKGKAAVKEAPEEVIEAAEEDAVSDEVVLTDAEGRRYCRVKDCDQLAAVDGYCRYHYLLYWKRIQVRKKILTEGKLERYVEELTSRYPDKFLDMLKKDLRSEKEFLAAIQELEIDESANENELEDETQTYIDEVRGMGETPAREDDGDF